METPSINFVIRRLQNLQRYDITGGAYSDGTPDTDVEEDDENGEWIKFEDITKLIEYLKTKR